MFADNTVFVVGAGASAEFNMPVGGKLTKIIKDNCLWEYDRGERKIGNPEIFAYFDKRFNISAEPSLKEFQARLFTMTEIHRSIDMAESIDEYIFRYADDPVVAEIGKLQIAYAIAEAERQCSLGPVKEFTFENDTFASADDTWISTFAKALMNGVPLNDIETIGNNITIICFNYDRCIEHYLEHAICRAYADVSLPEARKIVSKINIIHPYGLLGQLDEIPFGQFDRFLEMTENLITWSETIRDAQTVPKIRHAIGEAQTIAFLGFAFANQNMKLLNSRPTKPKTVRVLSTGLGLPQEVEDTLAGEINRLYSSIRTQLGREVVHFQYGAKCNVFMNIHRMNLVSKPSFL